MNLSVQNRSNTRQRVSTTPNDRRTPPWHHSTRRLPNTGNTPRIPPPVAPVVFLEPGHARRNTERHIARADRSDDTMHRLRTPFTPDEANHR